MTKKPKKEKRLRNRKLKQFKALVIKNKKWPDIWTYQLFRDSTEAYDYWEKYCAAHKFEFNWDNFEATPVIVTPLTTRPIKKK